MQFIYEFEIFKEDGMLVAVPYDLEGATEGEDLSEVICMASDWLRMVAEDALIHNKKLPNATFGNSPKHGGDTVIICVDVNKDSIRKVSAADAARMLGVTPARVSHLIRDGLLEAFKDGYRTWVTRDSLEARLAEKPKAGRPRKQLEG